MSEEAERLDWQGVRRRLREVGAAIEEALSPPPERVQQTLAARARRLAQPERIEAEAGDRLEAASFRLAGEVRAIESRFVLGFHSRFEITRLPGLGPEVLGLTRTRSRVLPVLDLAALLGLAPADGAEGLLMVLGRAEPELAVRVDEALELCLVSSRELRRPPAAKAGAGPRLVRGIDPAGLIVLDGQALLDDPRGFPGKPLKAALEEI